MEYQEFREAIIYGLMGKGIFISPDAYPILEQEIKRFFYRLKNILSEDFIQPSNVKILTIKNRNNSNYNKYYKYRRYYRRRNGIR